MNTNFNVEIIHKETITPSSPTSSSLKTLRLSFMDQIMPNSYPSLVYFYPNNADHEIVSDHRSLITKKSTLLKASLAKTLTHFYPFAGEFQYNHSIHCDDRGALFIEARVNCRLSDILSSPDTERLKCLDPVSLESSSLESSQAQNAHLLLVQVSFFECGGMAIAINISHKVADAFTASIFAKRWASVTFASKSTTDQLALPALVFGLAASLYPPQEFLNEAKKPPVKSGEEKCTTKRFVFDASRLAALKLKAASVAVPNPTRVEVVSALIWKCAMEASRSNSGGSMRPSLWWQAIDMRKRSGHAFTETLLGNFVWLCATKIEVLEREVADIHSLVALNRKCMEDYKSKHPDGLTAEEAYQTIKEPGNNIGNCEGIDAYFCNSTCWLPFYETNFGWGKPSWVTSWGNPYENSVLMMDGRDGIGIDTLLTFPKKNMTIIEESVSKLGASMLGEERIVETPHQSSARVHATAGKVFAEAGKRYFSSESRVCGGKHFLYSFISMARRGRFL